MTGFGRATFILNGAPYAIEIRTLNSKQLDLNVRIPSFLREKEMEIRSLVGNALNRGKIDVSLNSERKEESTSFVINKKVVQDYRKQIKEINQGLALDDKDYLENILKLPNVLQAEENELDESAWEEIQDCLKSAIDNLNEFRIQEGSALEKDLLKGVAIIEKLALEVEENAPLRIEKVKQRIDENLNKIKERVELNRDRFEQEIIFYIEKMDINEEIVRLRNHCKYFTEIVNEDISLKGKKIGFIAQEIGREINTIGSKANDATIQKLVVQMKDELEKIKEQSFNIL